MLTHHGGEVRGRRLCRPAAARETAGRARAGRNIGVVAGAAIGGPSLPGPVQQPGDAHDNAPGSRYGQRPVLRLPAAWFADARSHVLGACAVLWTRPIAERVRTNCRRAARGDWR